MRLLSIISLCTILSAELHAQDSTFAKISEYNALHKNVSMHYDAPALKAKNVPVDFTDIKAAYSSQESDKYIIQKGSGSNNFNIDIESFQTKKNNLSLWGNFKYQNIKTKNVNFNETLDYDYLYPYIMTDSVGGNLNDEHYTILGGLSKTSHKSTYGFETSFIGKQSVRSRDPRTNNISSNFNLKFSYAYQWNEKYNAAVSLLGDRYFQKSKISFNSELGRPTVYHETGLGNYNKIFADTRDNAEYLGYNYGITLHLVPNDQLGWFFSGKYVIHNIQKKIKDVAFVINEANKSNLEFNTGYKRALTSSSQVEIGASYLQKNITGNEGIFDNKDSQTGLQQINSADLFTANLNEVGGYLAYYKQYGNTIWNTKLGAKYINSEETYKLPLSEEKINFLNLNAELSLIQKIGKNKILADIRYSHTNPSNNTSIRTGFDVSTTRYDMLTNNFDYKSTKVSVLSGALKIALPVKTLQTFYVGINGSYAEVYKFKQFGITSGFVF